MVKKTKSTLLIVMLAIVLTLSVCLVGCGKEPIVTLKSQAEVSLQLGETSVVDYTAENADTVTVKVTKGDADVTSDVYDEPSKKFTAKEVGEFNLTITATAKKKSSSKTVKFTVAEASKTALNEAIAKADALVQSDYVNGWTNFRKAKTTAVSVASSAASTKEEVESALSALNAAMEALEAKEVKKAEVVSTGKQFTHNGITYDYTTHEEAGIDAAYAKVVELNNDDTKYTLQSQYDKLFGDIVASLVERLKMDIDTHGVYVIFSESETFKVGVSAPAGAELTYAVKENGEFGEEKAITGGTFDVTVNAGEEKEIRVKGTDGTHTNTKDIKIGATKSSYSFAGQAVNVSTFDPATGKLVNDKFIDWASGNQKKFIPDIELVGDFEARATVLFKEGTGDNQAFAINIDQGEQGTKGEFAVRYLYNKTVKGLKAGGGSDPSSDCGDRLETGKTNTFVLKRVNGTAYFYIEEKTEDGAVSKVGEVSMDTFTGPVRIGLNYENIKIEVTNIVFSAEQIYNKAALKAKIDSTKEYISADYTPDSWAAFSKAKRDATTILNKIGATQTEIDAAYNAMVEKEPVVAAIEKAVIAEGDASVAYGDKNYLSTMYTVESWQAFVTALKALNEKAISGYLPSVYDAEFKALLSEMVSTLKIESDYAFDKVNVVGDLKDVTFKAVTPEGIEVSAYAWELDGETVEGQSQQTYTAALEGEHTVTSVVTLASGGTVKASEKIDLRKGTISSKDGETKEIYVTAADGSYTTVKGNTPWTDSADRAWIEDMEFVGNYTVEMDVTYLGAYGGDAHVAAIMTNTASDNGKWQASRAGYAALLFQNGKIEVGKTVGREQSEDNIISKSDFSLVRVRLERFVYQDGSAKYTTSYIVNGEVIKSVDILEDNPDLVGNARIGFNAEAASVKFSNFIIVADGVVDTRALGTAIAEADKVNIDDYDAADEQVIAFKDAIALAKLSYLNNGAKRMLPKGTTQADVDALVTALTQATDAIKTLTARAVADSDKPVITAESADGAKDGKLEFGGVVYNQANVINYDEVLAAVNAIETAGMTVTAYRAAVKAELAKALEVDNTVNLNDFFGENASKIKTIGSFGQQVYKFVYTKTAEEVCSLKVNGETKTLTDTADGVEYLLIAEKGETYLVEFTAGETTVTLAYDATMQFRSVADVKATIGEDYLQLDKSYGWGDFRTNKFLSNLVVNGDYIRMSYDLEVLEQGDPNVIAVNFGRYVPTVYGMNWGAELYDDASGNGDPLQGNPKLVINYQSKKISIEGGTKFYSDEITELSKDEKYTYVLERFLNPTKYAVTILKADGSQLAKFEKEIGMHTGAIQFFINTENCRVKFSDIKVQTSGTIVDVSELESAIKKADDMNPAYYAESQAAALKTALDQAIAYKLNTKTPVQADVDAKTEALKTAITAAESAYEIAVKEITIDAAASHIQNISFHNDRAYKVSLTNLAEGCTAEATLDGETLAASGDGSYRFTFTASQGTRKLIITVKDGEGTEVSVNEVNVRDVVIQSKNTALTYENGVLVQDAAVIEWNDNDRIKAHIIGTFTGEVEVTMNVRLLGKRVKDPSVFAFMSTFAHYGDQDEGRMGYRYHTPSIFGEHTDAAKWAGMPQEIKYESDNASSIALGNERTLKYTRTFMEDTREGQEGKMRSLYTLEDITDGLTGFKVGQMYPGDDKNLGLGFQFEHARCAVSEIEIIEII